MTEKAGRGRPKLSDSERRRNTINVRLDDAARATLALAASSSGRSLSGEIQHRLTEYELLRKTFDILHATTAAEAAEVAAAAAARVCDVEVSWWAA